MNVFCTNCGTQVSPDSAFCANCGAAIQSPDPQPGYGYQPLAYAPPPPPGNGINPRVLMFGLIGLGALVIVTVLLVTLLGGKGPDDAVKDTFKAFANGDCDRVVELTYFGEGSTQTKEETRADCEGGQLVDLDVKVLATKDHPGPLPPGVSDAAEVEVRVSARVLGQKYKRTSTVVVYKVDGKWLVSDEDTGNSGGSE